MNKFDFDLSRYGYSKAENSTVPKGSYLLELIKIEEKTNKSENKSIVCTWRICDGKYSGAYLYSNLNVYHTRDETRSIARGELRTISKIFNKEEQLNMTKDFAILLNGVLMGEVDTREYDGKTYNDIKVYKSKESISSNEKQKPTFKDDEIPDWV